MYYIWLYEVLYSYEILSSELILIMIDTTCTYVYWYFVNKQHKAWNEDTVHLNLYTSHTLSYWQTCVTAAHVLYWMSSTFIPRYADT